MMRTMKNLNGILLCNLGTPKSTEITDVRRYLREFLMDPHVLQMPTLLRWLLVNLLILPFRPARTAEAYRSIWTREGSPLLLYNQRLRQKLATRLEVPVALGMRYGAPSLEDAVEELVQAGCTSLLLAPLYPQFADSTTTTCVEAVTALVARRGIEIKVIAPFYDEKAWLDAAANSLKKSIPANTELLLLSFHGLPELHIKKSDPTGNTCLVRDDCCDAPGAAAATCYRHQCFKSAREIAKRLGLFENRYRVSFQSRLGRAKWLLPATDQVLASLPNEGIRHLAVACPGFTADNLETLEEIGIGGKETFLAAGGESFTLVPCLNDSDEWVDALAAICQQPLSSTKAN